MRLKQCKHTTDGYCIRPENDYCYGDECLGCSHENQQIRVIKVVVNCETIQEYCTDCGKVLNEKVDC